MPLIHSNMESFQTLSAPDRIGVLAYAISSCTPAELHFASTLTRARLAGASNAAVNSDVTEINDMGWLSGLKTGQVDIIDSVHSLGKRLPHLKASNVAAANAVFDAVMRIPWHPSKAHPNDPLMCDICLVTMRMCECHPAFSADQVATISNLRAQLGASSLSYAAAPQQTPQVFVPGPATALVSINVVGIQKKGKVPGI